MKLKSTLPDNLFCPTYLSYQPSNMSFIAAEILTKKREHVTHYVKEAGQHTPKK